MTHRDQTSYRAYASFDDPDGNGWLLQEVTTRLPGNTDPTTTNFGSIDDPAGAPRRASDAHLQTLRHYPVELADSELPSDRCNLGSIWSMSFPPPTSKA